MLQRTISAVEARGGRQGTAREETKGHTKMTAGFEDFQKLGKDNVDVAVESAQAVTKGLQAIAAETSDFSKRAFEAGASAFGKISAARSLDTAVAAQSEFARAAYESYVGQVARVSEIVADMAKGASKPFAALFAAYGK